MAIILFDFDGVLADTLEDALRFGQQASAEIGLERKPTPDDLEALETMSVVEYGRQLKIPPEHIDEFVTRYLDFFNQKPDPPMLFKGIDEVIAQAARQNAIAIVTGNTKTTVEAFLKQHGLQRYISFVIGVEQQVSRPEKIKIAVRELEQSEEAVYMVGDSLSDIRAARETSAKSIAVGWGHQSISRLMTAHPDFIVHTVQELLALFTELGVIYE